MMFPTLFIVGVRSHSTGGYDDHGNPIQRWAEPVEQSVYGWSSPQSTEPKLAGHDRVIVDIELLAPPEFTATARDRVNVEGHTFEVVGEPEDFNHGPFGFRPGLVVNLRRVEG